MTEVTDEMREALQPFFEAIKGIPSNWPDECVLIWEDMPQFGFTNGVPDLKEGEVPRYIRRAKYLKSTAGDEKPRNLGPTIGEYRRLAKLFGEKLFGE